MLLAFFELVLFSSLDDEKERKNEKRNETHTKLIYLLCHHQMMMMLMNFQRVVLSTAASIQVDSQGCAYIVAKKDFDCVVAIMTSIGVRSLEFGLSALTDRWMVYLCDRTHSALI